MTGTPDGGKKAAETNKERWGPDFYKKIGQQGGKQGHGGGFGSDKVGKDGLTGRERASKAGYKGGIVTKQDYKRPYGESQEKESE